MESGGDAEIKGVFFHFFLLYGSMAAGQKDVDYGQHAGKWTTINSKATHGIMRGLTFLVSYYMVLRLGWEQWILLLRLIDAVEHYFYVD